MSYENTEKAGPTHLYLK